MSKFVYLGENQINSSNLKYFLHGVYCYAKKNKDILLFDQDVHIIFIELFNSPERSRFYDLPENNIQPNRESFMSSVGIKIVVDMTFTYFDPQIFHHTLKQDALYKNESLDTLSKHTMFESDLKFREDLKSYLTRVETPSNTFKNLTQDILLKAEKLKANFIVAPMLYYSSYKHSDILDDDRIIFVPYDHLIEKSVESIDFSSKKIDVALSGSSLPFVYPYRYLIREGHLLNNIEAFSFVDTYHKYIHEYIVPRTNMINSRDDMTLVSDLQDLNDKVHNLDNERYSKYLSDISNSKISICCSSIFGLPLKKFIECMGSGSVVVGDLPKFPDDCGIIHGYNAISCNLEDLEKTIKLLLSDEQYLNYLADNALNLVRSRYTSNSAGEFFFSTLFTEIKRTTSAYQQKLLHSSS